MRSLLAVFALVVASLLAIEIVPSQAAKAPAKRTSVLTVTAKDREIVALRTRGSKTFEKAGGQRVARVYAGAAHFKNARGRWQDIDTRLRRAHGRLLNRTNSFSTSLPLALGDDSVRVRHKSNWVAFSLRGAQARGVVRGDAVTYADAQPGVDVRYRLTPNAVKEDLVLKSASAPRSFVFDLEVRKGLRPKLLQSKGLVLRDRRNRTRMTIAAPFMADARGTRHRVGLTLANVGGRWRLTLRLSGSWLEKAGRAWPVTVDPAVYPASDADCHMSAAAPNTSYCSDQELWVGRIGGTDYQTVLRFADVEAAVPVGADVHGASLGMQQLWAATATSVKVDTRPLAEPFTNAATWNSNNGTHRWSEPGGEPDVPEDPEALKNATVEFPASITSGNGYRYFNFMRIVRDWASGKRANHGLLLKASAPTNGMKLYSSEATDPNKRPYLHIAYVPRLGDRRGYVHERQQITDRISLGVNVANGNLNVRQTDFSMPGGLGPAVSVSRSYNSLHQLNDELGVWSLDTGKGFQVFQNAGGAFVAVRFPSGAEVPYWRKPGTNEYDTPPGYDNKLTRNDTTGTYELTDNKTQTKYRFADYTLDGRLTEIEDRNGRKLTMVYSGADLIRIEDSNNDTATTNDDVRFTNTSGRITQMTDPAGRSYTYTYNSVYLTGFTDPENGSSYKTLYDYSGVDGQLSKITTPQGNITTIEYWNTNDRRYAKVKAVTRVTNTSNLTGNRTEFDYTIEPDGSGQARVTDPLGVLSADDNDRVTTYEFDAEGRVTSTKDALGRETARRITSTSYVESYTAAGNSGTTPNTKFSYDDGGTDPTFNLLGTETATHKDGATSPMTTTYVYGQAGQVDPGTAGKEYLATQETNEQGGVTKAKYTPSGDTNGNLSEIGQYTSGGSLVSNVTMQYAATSIDGKKGQLASTTDGRLPIGKITTYGYDAKGNLTTVDPPGSGANQLGTTTLTYDQNLNRISKVTDGKGNKRLLTFDNLDRLKKIEFTGSDESLGALEPKVEYTYDRDGNQTSEVTREEGTGTSRTRTMTYDALNRVTYEALPGGASNTYTYDAVGNLRSLTDGGGKTEYTYDSVNKVRSVYEPGAAKPTRFEHNKDGLRLKTRYPNNVLTSYSYDHASRLIGITSTGPSGTLQDFAYTYAQPSGAGGRQTPLRYETEDKSLGRRTRYGYDGLDRLEVAVTKTSTGTADDIGWANASAIASYAYALDPVGNITQRAVSGSGLTTNTTNLYYDDGNQLCWRSPTSGATTATPCAPGTRQTAFDGNGNEITGAASPSRSGQYHLTDQTKTFTVGASPTSFVYLGAGQDRWIQEGSATFQHNVLGLGRRSVSGTDTYFTRDESGALVSRRTGSAKEYYLFDALGSITGKTNGSTGAITARYDYEPYGDREMSAAGAPGSADVGQGEFGYASGYRSVGGMYHFGQRFYDPATMRWTQTDPVDATGDLREGNRYLYAANDPVGLSDPSGNSPYDGVTRYQPVFSNTVNPILQTSKKHPIRAGHPSTWPSRYRPLRPCWTIGFCTPNAIREGESGWQVGPSLDRGRGRWRCYVNCH